MMVSSHAKLATECISPASFWMPQWLRADSAWIEHAPFAFWLVEALRPGMIVELGCHTGYSYSAFCQAVQTMNLNCRCYGIDTWEGDKHAGYYGNEVFTAINDHNDRYYQSFSRLVRSKFDEALPHFAEASIDLLHIDGHHSYEFVEADYRQWHSRMSRSGVILFHDTNVRERGFGVARLWTELRKKHKHFEFMHGHGLGVLGVGDAFPDPLNALFRASSEPEAAVDIRTAYSRLGSAIRDRVRSETLQEAQDKIASLEREIANLSKRQGYLLAVASERYPRGSETEGEQLRRKLDAILNSRSWRMTAGFRMAMTMLRKRKRQENR